MNEDTLSVGYGKEVIYYNNMVLNDIRNPKCQAKVNYK